ncbi:hypothetical protein BDV93DRAFT_611981 [Ceratobasidium sp. AG-I]|nr:hypothetical protein BDV93DRAFT_611981 [Ceratobasidium sp. AG-I]
MSDHSHNSTRRTTQSGKDATPTHPKDRSNIIFPPTLGASSKSLNPAQTLRLEYTPRKLRTEIAQSPHAHDHISNIHVTQAIYGKQHDGDKQEFVIFNVTDSSMPSLSNILVLDRNDGSTGAETTKKTNQQKTVQTKGFNLLNLNFLRSNSKLAHFYISPDGGLPSHMKARGSHDMRDTLAFPDSSTFPLEHLIVLSSRLSSSSATRLNHISTVTSPNWFPRSMWNAMRLINFNYNQIPVELSTEPALVENAFTNLGLDVRKYRDEVIQQQMRGYSGKKRRAVLQSELDTRQQDIALQTEKANSLIQKNEQLAKEQQELLAKYQTLLQERNVQTSTPKENIVEGNMPPHQMLNRPTSLLIEASAA